MIMFTYNYCYKHSYITVV